MGQVIMLGSLLLVIVVIVGLVLRFDPEARGDRPGSSATDASNVSDER